MKENNMDSTEAKSTEKKEEEPTKEEIAKQKLEEAKMLRLVSIKLLTEKEVSEMFGIKPATLRTHRSRPPKDPIPFIKFGNKVRYKMEDIKEWIERNTHDSMRDYRLAFSK